MATDPTILFYMRRDMHMITLWGMLHNRLYSSSNTIEHRDYLHIIRKLEIHLDTCRKHTQKASRTFTEEIIPTKTNILIFGLIGRERSNENYYLVAR